MSCFSRRELLKHALTYAAVNSALKPIYGLPAGGRKTLIYVGTYDTPMDGSGNGKHKGNGKGKCKCKGNGNGNG